MLEAKTGNIHKKYADIVYIFYIYLVYAVLAAYMVLEPSLPSTNLGTLDR